jgi:hypothetical protein
LNSYGSGYANVKASSFNGYLRAYINASNAFDYAYHPSGSAYKKDTWISKRGSGNTTTPISINEGDTSINFQVNAVTFLCRTMVSPDLTAGCSAAGQAETGGRIAAGIYYNGTQGGNYWVTSTNIKERPPNAVGGDCMFPAYTGQARNLLSVKVYENGVYKKTIPLSGMIRWQRDPNSRYWLASPRYFTYTRSTGFTSDVTMKFVLTYQNIDLVRQNNVDFVIHKDNTGALTIIGSGRAYAWDVTDADLNKYWSLPRLETDTYTLNINVIPNPDFNLIPSSDANPDVITPNQPSVTVTAKINNNQKDTTPTNSAWGLARFVVPKTVSTTPTNSGTRRLSDNTNYPCQISTAVYAGAINCSIVASNGAGQKFTGNTVSTVYGPSANDVSGLGLNVGDRVCYATVVNHYDYDHDNYDWRYGVPSCVRVAKVPTVHVVGNDLRVGSNFTLASNSMTSSVYGRALQATGGKYYGSWGEYGVLAPNLVNGFASGSGLNPGPTSASQSSWSNLTFANTPSFGKFVTSSSQLGSLPDVFGFANAGKFTMKKVSSTAWPGGAANINLLVDKQGSDVTISSNINRPTGSYANVNSMPQMIILARNIYIHANVTNIDAWLVATGTIDTCSNGPSKFVGGPCDQNPLTINGPVMANTLILGRSFGADAGASLNTPAETINLRADTYIWAYRQSQLGNTLQTVSQRELPPRY